MLTFSLQLLRSKVVRGKLYGYLSRRPGLRGQQLTNGLQCMLSASSRREQYVAFFRKALAQLGTERLGWGSNRSRSPPPPPPPRLHVRS